MKLAKWFRNDLIAARREVAEAWAEFVGLIYDPVSLGLLIVALGVVLIISIGSLLG